MSRSAPATKPRSNLAKPRMSEIFELSPVPLWMEDWSDVRALLRSWRPENGAALYDLLSADPERTRACARLMRVIEVNPKTLELYQARDQRHLTENLELVFRDDFLACLPRELAQVWDANVSSSVGVNYTLSGGRLDVAVECRLMPGHEDDWSRVLVSTQDITALEDACRLNQMSERYAHGLFEHSPVSLWVEDFGAIKAMFDDLRAQGIEDLRVFTEVHPEFVTRCMSEIRILDVNRHTVKLFGARDKADLLGRLDEIFRDEMRVSFRETLIDLWHGKWFQQREVINYALDGGELYLHLQFSILPGHEDDWSQAQVALTDITARKKAEAYLEFLGRHDTLTKLKNRNFYVEELNRIERKRQTPSSIIVIDVNGLKGINDVFGHAAGDDLLRRVGEVLLKAAQKPNIAARIGGDEFVVLMPSAEASDAEAMVSSIRELVHLNNQFYSGRPLSLSMGRATTRASEHVEDAVRRADQRMYESKQTHYAEKS